MVEVEWFQDHAYDSVKDMGRVEIYNELVKRHILFSDKELPNSEDGLEILLSHFERPLGPYLSEYEATWSTEPWGFAEGFSPIEKLQNIDLDFINTVGDEVFAESPEVEVGQIGGYDWACEPIKMPQSKLALRVDLDSSDKVLIEQFKAILKQERLRLREKKSRLLANDLDKCWGMRALQIIDVRKDGEIFNDRLTNSEQCQLIFPDRSKTLSVQNYLTTYVKFAEKLLGENFLTQVGFELQQKNAK